MVEVDMKALVHLSFSDLINMRDHIRSMDLDYMNLACRFDDHVTTMEKTDKISAAIKLVNDEIDHRINYRFDFDMKYLLSKKPTS